MEEPITKNRLNKKVQIPSYDNGEHYNEDFLFNQCFESTCHLFTVDTDLFEIPCCYIHSKQQEVWQYDNPSKQVKKRPKAVDEDLYKIPSEIICHKRKKRMVMGDLCRRCFGLS